MAKKGIGTLPWDILEQCIIIPDDGIEIFYSDIFIPKFLPRPEEEIGLYYLFEDRVVFVYSDGSTRMARKSWIIKFLDNAGYTHGKISEPNTFGGIIYGPPEIREKWEKIRKK